MSIKRLVEMLDGGIGTTDLASEMKDVRSLVMESKYPKYSQSHNLEVKDTPLSSFFKSLQYEQEVNPSDKSSDVMIEGLSSSINTNSHRKSSIVEGMYLSDEHHSTSVNSLVEGMPKSLKSSPNSINHNKTTNLKVSINDIEIIDPVQNAKLESIKEELMNKSIYESTLCDYVKLAYMSKIKSHQVDHSVLESIEE